MAAVAQEELTDTVYRAALEPAAWGEVMALMAQRFPSAAQTFYFLHLEPRRVQPVSLTGIGAQWLRNFDEHYFTADNPWIRLSRQLHRTGLVRTNERLDRLLHTRGALYRSTYYNEWMRPQGFRTTLGNTLLAAGGVVANVTLLRAPDMATFSGSEVRAFEAISCHMTRALQMAVRLQCLESSPAGIAALALMPQAIAVVDAAMRLHHANPAMETLLRSGSGLALTDGCLRAAHPALQQVLADHVARTLRGGGSGHAAAAGAPLLLPLRQSGQSSQSGRAGRAEPSGALTVHAMPLSSSMSRHLPWRPMVLLVASAEAPARAGASIAQQFGCTAAECRLAQWLAAGRGLREAAQLMGITYGTARSTLKIVFDKTGVGSQAQLVALLLGGMATPHGGRAAPH